jgi:hypothetical protein
MLVPTRVWRLLHVHKVGALRVHREYVVVVQGVGSGARIKVPVFTVRCTMQLHQEPKGNCNTVMRLQAFRNVNRYSFAGD